MGQEPLVSVVIPTYNRADVLSRALDSVVSQTYENLEAIVVDDGSSDGIEDMVSAYDSVEYVRLDETKGVPRARNVGLQQASGRYVSFLDSDDEYRPKRFRTLVEVMEEEPGHCAGVFHAYVIKRGSRVDHPNRVQRTRISGRDIRHTNIIGGLTCTMFRKEALHRVQGFDDNLPSCQDYDLYLRLLDKFTMRGLDEVLSVHHVREDSLSTNLEATIDGQEMLMVKHGDRLSAYRKSHYYYNRFFLHAERGNLSRARKELLRAIRTYPFRFLYYFHLLFSLAGKRGVRWSTALSHIASDSM